MILLSLFEDLLSKPIILASSSPRRRELLTQIGVVFTTDPADVDERVLAGEAPEGYALRVARDKARAVAERSGDSIVIAADTIVVLGNDILGKPVDAVDAFRMLTLLSGRMHMVITGIVVKDLTSLKTTARTVITRVWFRTLPPQEIGAYVATDEPLDKAGAYGIQGKGALLIDRIDGCYFNVVGLPLSVLGDMLREHAITLL